MAGQFTEKRLSAMAKKDDLVHDPEAGLTRLIEIMRRLRDPETGCPWDIEQDFASIAPYTIEEAHEVADAIERGAWDELEGELGDLLLQVVYHARMGEERGLFDFASITRAISDKMVARHPHVFGNESRDKSAAQQTEDWERIKAAERAGQGEAGALDGVALGLPALLRAVKLQKRAAKVGFDWPDVGPVLDKITEEARELVEARDRLTPDAVEDEMGDLLFVLANLARHLGVNPETALRRTNAKFERRFKGMERVLQERGQRPEALSLDELDALWEAEKTRERLQDNS
ncbi:MAG TPA: nucleoside triphosphate pyrophosphohydrolase [Aliiroseovarius sp.]|nr:nucleoside triphosphate pyrophosphohydrolase [Aliiroseovarius sp.]